MHDLNGAGARRPRRVLACLVIGLVSLASWWPRHGGPIDLRWDGGAYYILGTSLAQGEGYRLLSEPGGIPSSLHPPFLPALVAVHQVVLGTSDPLIVGRVLRITVTLVSAAYAIAIFLLLSAYVPRKFAFTASLIGVFQPQYLYFSDALYAETFFGLFSVAFFIVRKHRRRAASFVLCGLCAILAYEVRTAGIALLAAWIADNLLRKDFKRSLIALAVSLAAVLSWMSWIKAVEASPEYQRPAYAYQTAPYLYFNVSYARNILALRDPWAPELGPLTPRAFLQRVGDNLWILPKSIGQAVSTWAAPRRLALPLALLVLAGLLLQARRRQYVMLLYVVLSLAAVCSTPFQQQFVRYLMTLFPFFALAMFQLLARLEGGVRGVSIPGPVRAIVSWLVVAVIAIQVFTESRALYAGHYDAVAYEHRGQPVRYRLFYYAPAGPAFDEALDWLNRRAKPSDVIAAGDPQWVFLRTGRKSVLPPFEVDGKKAQQLIDTVPAKYLIAPATGVYARFTSPMLKESPGDWTRIWRSSNGSIDVFERTGAEARGGLPR